MSIVKKNWKLFIKSDLVNGSFPFHWAGIMSWGIKAMFEGSTQGRQRKAFAAVTPALSALWGNWGSGSGHAKRIRLVVYGNPGSCSLRSLHPRER